MTKIVVLDGALYQWDTGRKVQVIPDEGTSVSEVHFSFKRSPVAFVLPQGEDTASIPDTILQVSGHFTVYAVLVTEDGRRTVTHERFQVIARAKPDDYIYTEEELLTYKALEERVETLEKGGASDEVIAAAVEKYLAENPVTGGATAEQAAQIEANTQAIASMAPETIGAAPADHSHAWAEVTDKPETFPPDEHTHTAAEVGALPATYKPPVTSVNGQTGDVVIAACGGTADSVAWDAVTGKPATFPPEEHTHSYTDLIDKPTIPSLEGYATENYVASEIAKAQLGGDGGEVDLSAYATTEYVDKAFEGKANTADLAPVATSGSYNDLTDKPTVTNGADGEDGEDGVSPTVGIVAIDGGNRVTVTDASGSKSFDVMNGVDGQDGSPGADGYTPVKGTDYWTEADKAEMVNDVLAALPNASGVSF